MDEVMNYVNGNSINDSSDTRLVSVSTILKNIKRLNDALNIIEKNEKNTNVYTYFVNEEPVIPEYNFKQTQDDYLGITNCLRKLKSYVRQGNCSVRGNNTSILIDDLLVLIPIYNRRAKTLNSMKAMPEKIRNNTAFGRNSASEYIVRNFDVNEVAEEAYNVTALLEDMQYDVDYFNANHFIVVPRVLMSEVETYLRKYK